MEKELGVAKYLNNHDKTYEVELALGKKTTTLDEEGEIVEERKVPEKLFDVEKINNVLQSFVGKIKQTPPIYSAIKVNGKKLYEYARKGQKVEIPTREVNIYNIQLQDIDKNTNIIKFKVECSKGTYIRTLCEDITQKLGTIVREEFLAEGIDLDEEKIRHFLHGVKLSSPNPDGIYRIYQKNKFIGIGIIEKKLLKRDIIL